MLQNNPVLKSKIDQLWNKFWSSGISNPLTAIEQITYLLFMKRLDDLDFKQQYDAEFTGEKFTSRFAGLWVPPQHRDKPDSEQESFAIEKHRLRWSTFKHMQAIKMLECVQSEVFPFLKDLNGAESNFTHHMQNAVFIIPKPSLLVEAIKTIDELFEEMENDSNEGGQAFQDIQGDVYEYLLSEIASAGKNGQFRTPRHIIKLVTDLVQPQLGHRIVDPACGTGGFLLGAYQYVVTQIATKDGAKLITDEDGFERSSVSSSLTQDRKQILGDSLYGYDIDSTMVRLGLMNLMMHGIDAPHIDYKDTLSKSFDEVGLYDIIMANPPFTGSIDKGDIHEDLTLKTTKTELLFLENIYRMLRKGGTAGVIIPQGVLFGSAKAFIEMRKILINKCDLKAVIAMPSGVFKPYAGVATAILIFTKVYDPTDKVTTPGTEHTFFYDMKDDGYTLDDKRNKKDGFGDLQDIVEKYNAHDLDRDTDRANPKLFYVPRQEIVDAKYDLSFGRYKKEVYEEIEYDAPGVIIDNLLQTEVGRIGDEDLAKIEGGIVKDLQELREMIR
jgi:type I restriction enzyme M protein